jgi:acetoin utilization protein AcuB
MFYVYDIDGLKFKGPMEELEQWRNVTRKNNVQKLEEDKSFSPYQKGTGSQATAAYEKMIARDTMVEPLVHIHQIMSTPVTTIHHDASLVEGWSTMHDNKIRQLIVISDRKNVMGVLSERDILKRVNVIGDDLEVNQELKVSDVIKSDIITTDSMSDIRRVARVLAYYHIDAVPVMDAERLVGIVTRGDILRGFAEHPKLNLWA